MRKDYLTNHYRIYIPKKVEGKLRGNPVFEELLFNGATIYEAVGIWHGEQDIVSVYEIFDFSGSLLGVHGTTVLYS